MANLYAFYLDYIYKQTHYRATWEPGKTLKLGQIGKLGSDGIFRVHSTLQTEGISFDVVTSEAGNDVDHTSNDKVTITTKLAGKAPVLGSALTKADAGVTIEFKSKNAIVYQSTGNKTSYIENLGQVAAKILEKYTSGAWDKDLCVITELVTSGSATIIISTGSTGSLDLKASANAGAAGVKLTDASLGFSVAREQGSTEKFICETGLTPLYQIHGIRDPWLGQASIQPKSLVQKKLTVKDFKARGLLSQELGELD